MVRNLLSLSMGMGIASSSQGPHWWAMWGSVSCSRTLRHAAQPCPVPGFELATFWSLVDLLYPLSYSCPLNLQSAPLIKHYWKYASAFELLATQGNVFESRTAFYAPDLKAPKSFSLFSEFTRSACYFSVYKTTYIHVHIHTYSQT